MSSITRALLFAAIAVLLVAGVAAAVLVDPADDRAEPPSPPATTVPESADQPAPTIPPPPPPPTGPVSRDEASRALCAELKASIQTVAQGEGIAGGLRLSRALNTYEDTADPDVVEPTRRLLTSAVRGDFRTITSAAEEVASSCARAGHPI